MLARAATFWQRACPVLMKAAGCADVLAIGRAAVAENDTRVSAC